MSKENLPWKNPYKIDNMQVHYIPKIPGSSLLFDKTKSPSIDGGFPHRIP